MGLKEIREYRGLTQEQLATSIGSKKQAISRLETGARDIKNIRPETMKKLCSALNCTAEDITRNTKYSRPEQPFLLIYANSSNEKFCVGFKTEKEIRSVMKKVKGEGCTIIKALEINSCRDVLI